MIAITHTHNFNLMRKDATYTGKTSGNKRSWNEAGKKQFNEYMKNVYLDRRANGTAFDARALRHWTKTYSKKKDTTDTIQNHQQIRTYNDCTIEALLSLQHNAEQPLIVADTWDDNDSIGAWEEET